MHLVDFMRKSAGTPIRPPTDAPVEAPSFFQPFLLGNPSGKRFSPDNSYYCIRSLLRSIVLQDDESVAVSCFGRLENEIEMKP
jgi:hypothetical protein